MKSTTPHLREDLLTPRFYTTEINKAARTNLKPKQRYFEAMLQEMATDHNCDHFDRRAPLQRLQALDPIEKQAYESYLVRSCISEFSGFLLFKELSRQLQLAKRLDLSQLFKLMARDEARHAGFLNRALVLYTVFLSEKIGYWRYILIKRHLEKNPANKFAPLFDYFDAWCQDENRHGDIFNMLLQCWPGMTKGIRGKLLSRLFLWLVFLTHSLTVAERSNFYELLGMDARQFDTEVIKATNRSARRAFPVVFKLTGTNFMAHRDGIVHCFQQLQTKAAKGWRFDCFLIRLKLVGHGLRQFLSPMELA